MRRLNLEEPLSVGTLNAIFDTDFDNPLSGPNVALRYHGGVEMPEGWDREDDRYFFHRPMEMLDGSRSFLQIQSNPDFRFDCLIALLIKTKSAGDKVRMINQWLDDQRDSHGVQKYPLMSHPRKVMKDIIRGTILFGDRQERA